MDRHISSTVVQEVFGVCSVSSGMEVDEDTKEPGTMLNRILKPEKRRVMPKDGKWKEIEECQKDAV